MARYHQTLRRIYGCLKPGGVGRLKGIPSLMRQDGLLAGLWERRPGTVVAQADSLIRWWLT